MLTASCMAASLLFSIFSETSSSSEVIKKYNQTAIFQHVGFWYPMAGCMNISMNESRFGNMQNNDVKDELQSNILSKLASKYDEISINQTDLQVYFGLLYIWELQGEMKSAMKDSLRSCLNKKKKIEQNLEVARRSIRQTLRKLSSQKKTISNLEIEIQRLITVAVRARRKVRNITAQNKRLQIKFFRGQNETAQLRAMIQQLTTNQTQNSTHNTTNTTGATTSVPTTTTSFVPTTTGATPSVSATSVVSRSNNGDKTKVNMTSVQAQTDLIAADNSDNDRKRVEFDFQSKEMMIVWISTPTFCFLVLCLIIYYNHAIKQLQHGHDIYISALKAKYRSGNFTNRGVGTSSDVLEEENDNQQPSQFFAGISETNGKIDSLRESIISEMHEESSANVHSALHIGNNDIDVRVVNGSQVELSQKRRRSVSDPNLPVLGKSRWHKDSK